MKTKRSEKFIKQMELVLAGRLEGKTFEELGNELGVRRERIRQIQEKAIEIIRADNCIIEVHEDPKLVELKKIRISELPLSTRTKNSLIESNIVTIAGLIKRKEYEILCIDGMDGRGLQDIKSVLEEISESTGVTIKLL